MSKWIKVESDFLRDALLQQMKEDTLSFVVDSRYRVQSYNNKRVIHSFTQIDKHRMVICWEGVDNWGNRVMTNTTVNTNW